MTWRERRIVTILSTILLILMAALLVVLGMRYRASRDIGKEDPAPGETGVAADQNAYTSLQYDNGSTTLSFTRDDSGTWLDAYSTTLRTYVVELCRELYDMGFDEVILADVAHPVLPEPEEGQEQAQLVYTRDMSTTPTAVNAVCGFALSVAEKLSDREGVLSIYLDSRTALVKPDTQTGQDGELFLKVFDRAYIRTDKYAYPYNADDIKPRVYIGSVYDRLVPVVENYIPSDNSSWILIDVEEE